MKIKKILTVLAAVAVTMLIAAVPVHAEDCDHNWQPADDPYVPCVGTYTQRFQCVKCGAWDDREVDTGVHGHEWDIYGNCTKCDAHDSSQRNEDAIKEREKNGSSSSSGGGHTHYYDAWGRCIGCGYYPGGYGYYWGYPVVPVAPVVAPVVNTGVITMTNGATLPVAAAISNIRDTANQVALAATLSNLGYKSVVPGTTFNLYAPTGYNATGVPQAIMYPAAVSGLKGGDTAFAVYWNGIIHSTQFIPVTVDAAGNAAFVVPNMTGTSIVTLVKCR